MAVGITGPIIYFVEESDPGFGMAFGLALVVKVVKRGPFGCVQLVEDDLLVDTAN